MKKNVVFYILLSILVTLILVPFNYNDGITAFELIIKFGVIPVIMILSSIGLLAKSHKKEELSPIAYFPYSLFLYYISISFIYLSAIITRTNETIVTFGSLSLDKNVFYNNLALVCLSIIAFGFAIGMPSFVKIKDKYNHAKPVVINIVLYIFVGIIFFFGYRLTKEFNFTTLFNFGNFNSEAIIKVAAYSLSLLIIFICVLLNARNKVDSAQLVEKKFVEAEEKTSPEEKNNVPEENKKPTLEELVNAEEKSKAEEKVIPSEKVEEEIQETAKKPSEEIKSETKEEIIKKSPIIKKDITKDVKFKPGFRVLMKYIQTLDNVTYKTNELKTTYRFFVDDHLFLIAAKSQNEYKITFLYDLKEISNLLVKYPGTIVKAKTPKGPNWFKLRNKGQFNEIDLTSIINKAYDIPLLMKTRRKEANKERRRIAAQKRRAREKLEKMKASKE